VVDIQGASLSTINLFQYKFDVYTMVSISIKLVSDSSISCFYKMTINQDQIAFISHSVDISQNKAYHIQEYFLLLIVTYYYSCIFSRCIMVGIITLLNVYFV
jgi:hypothetical protein